MRRIREEAARRRKSGLPEEISSNLFGMPEPGGMEAVSKEGRKQTRVDRFLWEYGTRYARMINKIPVLRTVAEKQYLRLASEKTHTRTSAIPYPSNDQGLSFLAANWYYHDFLERTKKEGLRGKIKLLLLRSIGFFAWWQGEINRAVYGELNRLKLTQDRMNQGLDSMRSEFDGRQRDLLSRQTELVRVERDLRDRMIEGMGTKLALGMQEQNERIHDAQLALSEQDERIQDAQLALSEQQRRLTLLLDEVKRLSTEPLTSGEAGNIFEDHILDSFYASFEDQFRGTREQIKEKQRMYLPYMEGAKAGTEEAPILDVGCGRGEWLELLRGNGYVAEGVDRNRVLVQQCRELGLHVTEADAIQFLRKQEPNRFGVITGFHLIEHLSLRNRIALFDESLRVLKSGGLVIFETPNPTNLFVSTYDFYRDPTHVRPVHPDTANFLLERRGFIKTGAYFIEDGPPFKLIQSKDWNLNDLNGYLNASRDFVLIGYKR